MALGVSVVVCCYNSAGRLPETLKHLAGQQVSSTIPWEIIVVDNGSNDKTTQTAFLEWVKYNFQHVGFKVLNELKPGKNNALNTGINSAVYDYILICDDDNWLNDNYIEKAFKVMQSDSTIGAAGGQSIAIADIEIPEWFGSYQHAYAVGKQSTETGDISAKKYLWGAGIIFKKNLFISAYNNLPSFLTGPKEDTLSRGEDVEFCMRILLLKHKLYYDEALFFKHYMPNNRLTKTYQQKLFEGHNYERLILDLYSKQIFINKLSILEKAILLLSGTLRYYISKTFTRSSWNPVYESEVIYLLTGLQLAPASTEAIKIRELALELAANKPLQNAGI